MLPLLARWYALTNTSDASGAAKVLASQKKAGHLGIAGVPLYVFNGR
jgi:hypothetical protein